jgi:hypothetical protein
MRRRHAAGFFMVLVLSVNRYPLSVNRYPLIVIR